MMLRFAKSKAYNEGRKIGPYIKGFVHFKDSESTSVARAEFWRGEYQTMKTEATVCQDTM